MKKIPLIASAVFIATSSLLFGEKMDPAFPRIPVIQIDQTGKLPEGVSDPGIKVLANEPEGGGVGLSLDFDLDSLSQPTTPLAVLQFGLERFAVKRPGQKPGVEGRGALHVMAKPSGGESLELMGSAGVSPAGIPTPYTIDVTRAVSDALTRPAGKRKLHLELKMTGKPAYYEVYKLIPGPEQKPPTLVVAPSVHWTQDWAKRLQPVQSGPVVYREACMPITQSREKELTVQLMYPAKKIVEVIDAKGGELQEGRDWILRDGKLVLPVGSKAPIQLASEFFAVEHKNKNGGVTKTLGKVHLVEGTWYRERQMEVTYEPSSRDWKFPAPVSTLDNLPRLKKLLEAKAPVKLVFFGDSISLGGNASKHWGTWPYQPPFGELVAWGLQQQYGNKITYMNHSRGGAGAAFGASQAASQAGWFKPDLAIIGYGMNDRGERHRKTYPEDLQKIIDSIRKESPETELIVVTSMLNNPEQPSGLEPVLGLRDVALKISRPGLAFVDMTTTHLELIKHKNYLDTSGNGANHPNDFLHRIYAQRILEVLTPAKSK